ncbi:MAG: GTPase HflX [Puniceicoccales bacterium]|jgi:GTP-binding protein HflX|nr:GTPase HflX [Puniceicoccales bacterium]
MESTHKVDGENAETAAQTAFLVGLQRAGESPKEASALISELHELVTNLGITVGDSTIVRIREEHPRYLVGAGKMEEIAEKARAQGCKLIIFDDSLSPAQQRNWENDSKLRVIDRQEVILDIFASRASTREAVLQVELARLEIQLPRLKRLWSHLDRQRGGGSTQRDAGETQIEMDRRLLRKRIAKVRTELEAVKRHRATQRKQRQRVPLPTAAIVGYTNAGKSSLLNKLTGTSLLAANKLFATLDPTTRRLTLPNGRILLLTDTVGFVRRLPHQLVDAFKSTLEEAVQADFLIQVIDISSPEYAAHWQTTRTVLAEIGAAEKPLITVFNKIDTLTQPTTTDAARELHPDATFVSAHTGEGIETLLAKLEQKTNEQQYPAQLFIPHERHDFLGKLRATATVLSEKHEDTGVRVEALLPPRILTAAAAFTV